MVFLISCLNERKKEKTKVKLEVPVNIEKKESKKEISIAVKKCFDTIFYESLSIKKVLLGSEFNARNFDIKFDSIVFEKNDLNSIDIVHYYNGNEILSNNNRFHYFHIKTSDFFIDKLPQFKVGEKLNFNEIKKYCFVLESKKSRMISIYTYSKELNIGLDQAIVLLYDKNDYIVEILIQNFDL